jgi:peroxiredoxin
VELRNNYEAFRKAGGEVIALAVAPVTSVNTTQQSTAATYPLLADPDHRVAEAYGVYNLLGDGLAAPSVFVIETDGRIAWSHVSWNPGDRPSAQMILEQLPSR